MRRTLWTSIACIAIILFSYPLWKNYAKRNKWVVIAANVGQDSLRRYGFKSGQIGQDKAITIAKSQISAQVEKIRSIYAQYLYYAGWSRADVAGKRMLELGPGFTVGVPLSFSADGG